ncbi:sensor histidine kinase [Flavobacterium sp.]|uniref:sensor histidine kinase n=1 Tax=Flavobacterium sp. TaxID=239 RepID=UPI003D6A6EF2
MGENQDNLLAQDTVSFSVDAGIINRLGKELVGRAETAVSELVKNAYDADATSVELLFVNTDAVGGTLEIFDNGNGMTREQLINGFMRLSSSDKFHNPVSPKFNRVRAGKKGIGRFATQRLGRKLTILTKAENSSTGLKLEVDWNRYEIDNDLSSIQNPISELQLDFSSGTKLIISDLREAWWETPIKRVFRYISDLLQPTFLSKKSLNLNIASENSNESFVTKFIKSNDGVNHIIADVDSMIFDHAIGIIEGYIENNHGITEVVSNRFNVNDTIDIPGDFSLLENIHFKSYYFIYKFDWYDGYIPKMDYNKIADLGANNGGIKLYRNGFRVLPYGERGNDWINIDKNSVKAQNNAYVPFNNHNFFGFVEVIDSSGENFEETSSREGLIENEAFSQLTDFVYKALRQAAMRINSARLQEKNSSNQNNGSSSNSESNSSSGNTSDRTGQSTKEKLESLKKDDPDTNSIIDEAISKLEEIEMLRVLAGIGLNIAEFTHEIRQFVPSFNGSINYLIEQDFDENIRSSLLNLQDNFNRFKSYTSYIDHTITQNSNREKRPIDLRSAVRSFHEIVLKDLQAENILLTEEYYGYDLYTYSMHPSELTSILYNLYTNAKKAIKRVNRNDGKIQIICGKDDGIIYIEFLDNGDGIPEKNKNRIFDAFFTTSAPSGIDASQNEMATGTGLGLKIVKDIISAYSGTIDLIAPEQEYITNFRIELPQASEDQLQKYGY